MADWRRDAAALAASFEWRRLLFDQLFGETPAVRRGYVRAEDRDRALSTIEDPEAREIVEVLTSKAGVAL
jgi:hypothetical protein